MRAPWDFGDRIATAAPDYPREDRGLRHEGEGFFRVAIDPKTGVPTQVSVLKSTGYARLDVAAITALRRWRWKPGTWKEVDLPVKFTMSGTGRPPPGAIRLP